MDKDTKWRYRDPPPETNNVQSVSAHSSTANRSAADLKKRRMRFTIRRSFYLSVF